MNYLDVQISIHGLFDFLWHLWLLKAASTRRERGTFHGVADRLAPAPNSTEPRAPASGPLQDRPHPTYPQIGNQFVRPGFLPVRSGIWDAV